MAKVCCGFFLTVVVVMTLWFVCCPKSQEVWNSIWKPTDRECSPCGGSESEEMKE